MTVIREKYGLFARDCSPSGSQGFHISTVSEALFTDENFGQADNF